jgi:hypothetical protein
VSEDEGHVILLHVAGQMVAFSLDSHPALFGYRFYVV